MNQYLLPLCLLCASVSWTHASILAEEGFAYAVGSPATAWNGGSGFSGRWQVAGTPGLQGEIVTGLTFGTLPVSGNALRVRFAQSAAGLGSGNVFRIAGFGAVSSGELWVSYLYRFDSAAAAAPEETALQLRLGTILRSGINENTPALTVRYNASPEGVSPASPAFKDGTTLLLIFAYPGLGTASGGAAKGWAFTVSGYESLIAAGATRENLDAFALASVTSAFDEHTSVPAGVQLQVVPFARNAGSVAVCTVDELKVGTSLADVLCAGSSSSSAVSAGAGAYLFESFDYVPGTLLKKMGGGEGFRGGNWNDTTGDRGDADIAAEGLTLNGLAVSGKALALTFAKNAGNETLAVSRSVMTVDDPSNPVWISLLCRFSPDTPPEALANLTVFFRVVGGDRTLKYRIGIADKRPSIQHSGGKTNEGRGPSLALKPGTVYLLVAHFPGLKDGAAPSQPCALWVVENALPGASVALDTPAAFEKWLDQAAAAKATAPMTNASLRAGDVMHIGLWGRKGTLGCVTFDEIRFGSTPAAVLPQTR